MKILIAGAGIGGLTAALALIQRGFAVQVLEQAAELREVGAGVQLSPNATRALFLLGLEGALQKVACVATGKRVRLWNTGQTWKLFDLGAESVVRYGYPYITMARFDLHKVLADAVRQAQPDAIRLSARCTGAVNEGHQVLAQLEGGETIAGDVLVGADVVHS